MVKPMAWAGIEVRLEGECADWQVAAFMEEVESGIAEFHFQFSRPEPAVMPAFALRWEFPDIDLQGRWSPLAFRSKLIPPNWGSREVSQLASGAPVMTLFNQAGENRLTFAFSDAMNQLEMYCGVEERNSVMECALEAFRSPTAPVSGYECILRLDIRPVRYEHALNDVAAWWAEMPEYRPSPVPAEAREVVYSSWYSYHQDLFAPELEAECRAAAGFGMKSIIVDDGWQTLDNHRGYAFCGDWEVCQERFPDMAAHVRNVHASGLKYVLWYSMPWLGKKCRAFERFRDKTLFFEERLGAAALDPRFPEVRDYLIGLYEKALREWDLDGFKLDFIDTFEIRGEDPAVAENYAGRDFKSLPEAVDVLLSETMRRLRAIKPEVMIEFRQRYIGPAMRKYGNMFRAADCPNDAVTNRVRTIDVRMLAGDSAVHADMLMWNYAEPVETAALQLLNVLFAVPQVSVRLEAVPADHRAMLRFYLGFWREYRDVLLDGTLRADHPELDYPRVTAIRDRRQVTALYAQDQVVEFAPAPGDELCIVNASGKPGVYLDLAEAPVAVELFSATGMALEIALPAAGPQRVGVPAAGLLRLRF